MATRNRKKDRIVLPEQQCFVQPLLFARRDGFNPFPPTRTAKTITPEVLKWFDELMTHEGPFGFDLEYYERKTETGATVWIPSILGVASRDLAIGVPWDTAVCRLFIEKCLEKGTRIVAFAGTGADKPVVDEALGVETPREVWADSMLTHYLCNQDFVKTTHKVEDADDSSSLGFMNLWTAASMTTMLPHWKSCSKKFCSQTFCPTHDVFGYCAIDAWAGLMVWLHNLETLKRFNFPIKVGLDDMHELAHICNEMKVRGVAIDWDRVAALAAEMETHKDGIFEYTLDAKGEKQFKAFNPNSPKQILEWFKQHGIVLENTDKKTVFRELEKVASRYSMELSEFREYQGPLPIEHEHLLNLAEYKESGKGVDAWFGPRYRGADGLIHPRFILTGTSSSRLASSKPNFQNIGKRGWAKRLKSCVVPRSPHLHLLSSDSSQLELRICLWAAGESPSRADTIFEDLVAKSDGKFKKAAEFAKMSERDVAKSVVHASNYLEGITILSEDDLRRDNIKKEIEEGALVYDPKWNYAGGVVGFTGSNLADRLFGNHTRESRRLALELRKQYVTEVPAIARWQQRTLRSVEENGYVQLPTGHFLRLYGNARDNAKIAIATWGQGGGAQYIQGVMLRFFRERGAIPVLNVHDELVFEVPREWSDKQCYEFISLMYEPILRMPGFKAPGKAKRGKNYGEMQELTL